MYRTRVTCHTSSHLTHCISMTNVTNLFVFLLLLLLWNSVIIQSSAINSMGISYEWIVICLFTVRFVWIIHTHDYKTVSIISKRWAKTYRRSSIFFYFAHTRIHSKPEMKKKRIEKKKKPVKSLMRENLSFSI